MILAGGLYLLTGCNPSDTTAANSGNTAAANSNAAANTAAKPAAAPATMDAIASLEKSGWEAWKNKDQKTFESLVSDRIIDFGKDGRMDKAAISKMLFDSKCDVKSYSWADQKLTNLSNDVAILTFKSTQDITCDGKKSPSPTYVATVYAREGDKWMNVLYMENKVSDPKKPIHYPAPSSPATAGSTTSDATTDQLMAIEKKAWDAWKARDKAGVESMMAPNFVYFGDTGFHDRADVIKLWSEPKCEGLDYTVGDAKGFAVTPDVMLVTYSADVKGKCDGNPVTPGLWVASFDAKEGNDWKNAFYIDLPRQ